MVVEKTLWNPTKFWKSRILLIFLYFQRAEHLLVMIGVGNDAQRHGRGKQAKCCALPRPPSCQKRCKKSLPPADGDETGSSLFWKNRSCQPWPAERGVQRKIPLCRSFLPKLFWRQKSFGLTGGEGWEISIFQGTNERLASRGDFQRKAVFCKCSVLKSQNLHLWLNS